MSPPETRIQRDDVRKINKSNLLFVFFVFLCEKNSLSPRPENVGCTLGHGQQNMRGVRTFSMWLALWLLGLCQGTLLGAAEPTARPWIPLIGQNSIPGWTITGFAGKGDIEIQNGELTLHQGVITGIHYTNTFPKVDYEIHLEAKRVLGNDFFCGLTFPYKDTFATLIVGGWGGTVVGLSSIDGQDASLNDTTRIQRFDQDRWYHVHLKVTADRISAFLDKEPLFDLETQDRSLSLRPGDIELSKPLGLATWHTTAMIRNLEWRSLEEPPPTPPTPEVSPAGTASASPEPPFPARRVPWDGYQLAALPPETAPVELPALYSRLATQLHEESVRTPFAWNRMAELCDRFGPRFSGTTNLEAAIDWILAEMKSEGLDNVRGEPVLVPRWVRGEESATVLKPWNEALPMLGLGGSIGTPPEGITASVLVVTNFAELNQRAEEARGRIVVYDVPFTQYGESVRYRYSGAVEAARVGAVASLVRSIGDFGLRTPHTGGMTYQEGVPRIPHAALALEDTQRLRRWQERGVVPQIHLKMSARTEPDTQSRNVIAEIRGREFPDEIVVVGGHIDSWDVGLGAVDDAGGCIAAWEVLRLVRSLGLQPRRTLRCVLWTNEENGMRGARAYRQTHADEMDRHVAGMESDNGTFQPLGFGFTGSDAGLAVIHAITDIIRTELGVAQVFRGGADADTGPLLEAGVPVLGLRVDRSRYFWYHHTAADTPDKLDPRELAQCAAAMAIMAYTLADLPEALPRGR